MTSECYNDEWQGILLSFTRNHNVLFYLKQLVLLFLCRRKDFCQLLTIVWDLVLHNGVNSIPRILKWKHFKPKTIPQKAKLRGWMVRASDLGLKGSGFDSNPRMLPPLLSRGNWQFPVSPSDWGRWKMSNGQGPNRWLSPAPKGAARKKTE